MGLFNKKDKAQKTRPDELNPVSTAPPTSNTTNTSLAPQHSHQNSYHDSAYHSNTGSNVSEEPAIQKQQQTQLQNQPPGTTITTTTTTTTVTTTVTSDGRMNTSTHPYNPITDPPIRTQETSINDDTSRTNTIGGSLNTSSNPNSSTNVPQTQIHSQPLQSSSANLQPTPQRPQAERTISPGRKPTPQELQTDSHFNIIPPTPLSSQVNVPPSPTTTGGRIIPPRSDMRSSPIEGRGPFGSSGPVEPTFEFMNGGPESPGPPMRSEKRNSIDRGLTVAPLKPNHSPSNSNSGSRPVSSGGVGTANDLPRRSYETPPPVVPPKDRTEQYFPSERNVSLRDSYNQGQSQQAYEPYDPSQYQTNHHAPNGGEHMASGGLGPDARSHTHTPNDPSRPGPTVYNPSEQFDAPPTSASAMHPPPTQNSAPTEKVSHRKSLTSAFKGIQGASEVLRGSINSGIAKGTHDKAEQERMRAVREQGMKDYKASGLSERMFGGRAGEKVDGGRRLRKRSLSRNGVHGTEGPGGLEAVEERSIGDGRS